MKAQAKEEKQRRQIEKKKLAKEIELRKNAEREKQQLEQQLMQLQGDMRSASEALVCTSAYIYLSATFNHILCFVP